MTDRIPQSHYGPVETFPLGVRRYYLENGELAIVVGTGVMTREAIDEWAGVVLDVVRQRGSSGQPIYLLSDTSDRNQGFSNHVRRRITEIHNALPDDVPIFVAALFSPSIILQFVSIFFENLARMSPKRMRVRTFTDRDEAVAWLNEMRMQQEDSAGH